MFEVWGSFVTELEIEFESLPKTRFAFWFVMEWFPIEVGAENFLNL